LEQQELQIQEVEVVEEHKQLDMQEDQESLLYQHQELKSLPESGHYNVNTIIKKLGSGQQVQQYL
jgi:hypothetical protein